MVIQCSSCDTRFKIADDKVKAGGVKVRCSKCKEIFTVLPAEEGQTAGADESQIEAAAASESSSDDLNDLNTSFTTAATSTDNDESSTNLDDVDWDSLNSDEDTVAVDEPAESAAEISSSDFSFGDEETSPGSAGEEDVFSFGGDTEDEGDTVIFDELVGEGTQDEFSFDEEPATTADSDDFDWDNSGSADAAAEDDSFGFDESSPTGDSLDFSPLEITEDKEAAPVEVAISRVEATPVQAPTPTIGESQPASIKGPQKSGTKGRRGQKRKKEKGPLRGILTLFLFLAIVIGGGLYGLQQMGFWSGNFEELPDVDYVTAGQTAWDRAMVELNKLAGNEVTLQPVGSITVIETNGKYIQNAVNGIIFVIEGKIRNDYTANRSAILVRGTLYDAAGTLVSQQNVYCGNSIDNQTLSTETLEALQVRGTNEFGDSLSNLNVAPGTLLPFTIVFSNLPENLAEYNVDFVDSVAGAKQ